MISGNIVSYVFLYALCYNIIVIAKFRNGEGEKEKEDEKFADLSINITQFICIYVDDVTI